jgi:hypothetical protein
MPRTDYNRQLLLQRWAYYDHKERYSELYQERKRLRQEQALQPKMTCQDYIKLLTKKVAT